VLERDPNIEAQHKPQNGNIAAYSRALIELETPGLSLLGFLFLLLA